FQSTFLQSCHRLAQVVHAIYVDGPLALEVVGEQDVRRAVRQLDHRHARAHSLDRKRKSPTDHLREETSVSRHVVARRVEIVELQKPTSSWRSRKSTQGPLRPASTR